MAGHLAFNHHFKVLPFMALDVKAFFSIGTYRCMPTKHLLMTSHRQFFWSLLHMIVPNPHAFHAQGNGWSTNAIDIAYHDHLDLHHLMFIFWTFSSLHELLFAHHYTSWHHGHLDLLSPSWSLECSHLEHYLDHFVSFFLIWCTLWHLGHSDLFTSSWSLNVHSLNISLITLWLMAFHTGIHLMHLLTHGIPHKNPSHILYAPGAFPGLWLHPPNATPHSGT